jgi:SAM-dependent methyltransferase
MNTYPQGGDYTPGREARWKYGVDVAVKKIAQYGRGKKYTILDIGCGDGSFLHMLNLRLSQEKISHDKFEYFGIDGDKGYKNMIEERGGNFINGDIIRLEKLMSKLSFNLVVASEVIEHVDETDVLITSIKRVLRPDGLIYLTTPNLAAWHSRIMLMCGYQPLSTEVSNLKGDFGKGVLWKKYYDKPIHHLRIFTFKAMREFVEFHDLKIVKSIGGGYRWYDSLFFGNILRGLAPVIIMLLRNNQALPETDMEK